jgi:inosine/xanthosine triphosphatase
MEILPLEKVIVASHNPVKLRATQLAFQAMFPTQRYEFDTVSVPSEVSVQPFSDRETLRGATNRAYNARAVYPDAHAWIGIEGGVELLDGTMWSFAWAVVVTDTLLGQGKTGMVQLPRRVANLVEQGMELGEADDKIFGRENSKHAEGAVGLLTAGVFDRATYYRDAVVFALIPLKNSALYLD